MNSRLNAWRGKAATTSPLEKGEEMRLVPKQVFGNKANCQRPKVTFTNIFTTTY